MFRPDPLQISRIILKNRGKNDSTLILLAAYLILAKEKERGIFSPYCVKRFLSFYILDRDKSQPTQSI